MYRLTDPSDTGGNLSLAVFQHSAQYPTAIHSEMTAMISTSPLVALLLLNTYYSLIGSGCYFAGGSSVADVSTSFLFFADFSVPRSPTIALRSSDPFAVGPRKVASGAIYLDPAILAYERQIDGAGNEAPIGSIYYGVVVNGGFTLFWEITATLQVLVANSSSTQTIPPRTSLAYQS